MATTKKTPRKAASSRTVEKQVAKRTSKVAKKATGGAASDAAIGQVAKKADAKRPVASKLAKKTAEVRAKKAAGTTATTAASSRKPARGSGITPAEALANTQALLAAKQAQVGETAPWQELDDTSAETLQPGFQSDEARVHAVELHDAEIRLRATQGSVSSSGRRNQGRRDNRKGA